MPVISGSNWIALSLTNYHRRHHQHQDEDNHGDDNHNHLYNIHLPVISGSNCFIIN